MRWTVMRTVAAMAVVTLALVPTLVREAFRPPLPAPERTTS